MSSSSPSPRRASLRTWKQERAASSVLPAVRRKYLERFNAFMEPYHELFRGLEMPHCVVRTDDSPWHALALFLAERKRLH